MTENYKRLIKLLKELFQIDRPDLDFGIYRIMNQKRDEIAAFLDKDLLPQVKKAFASYGSGGRGDIQAELDKMVANLKDAGIDPDSSPKVKELKDKLNAAVDVTGLENKVYSHLYNFFRRYYKDGDFLSLRRYKKDVYAIPYEGEEVKLHWANADQYYIKSSENFRDYTFKLGELPGEGEEDTRRTVHFKLVEADTELANNKAQEGKERRFVLCSESPMIEEDGELFIRFEYKPLAKKQTQKSLNESAVKSLLDNPEYVAWIRELAREENGTSILEKHLNSYTDKNLFDYFIHKDLGGFLRRELDFFIKNEVMHLDDIEEETAPRVEQYLSQIKVLRQIAHKLISFLEQLENFQKKLWLKKKFVVETNYCITLDRVPEKLYPEICANDAQREEWVKLFAIDEIKGDAGGLPGKDSPAYSVPLTADFLKANDKLVLDTAFFSSDFKARLITSIENFDEQCDGLLIHSENFQALNLLQERYRGHLKCIHIDPPYNTDTSGFLYKNSYQHSSWLSLMENRISLSINLLSKNASYLCHIDENEYENLHNLFENSSLLNSGTIIWDKRNPMNGGNGVANQHEYIIVRSNEKRPICLRNKTILSMLSKAASLIKKNGGVTENTRKQFSTWVNSNEELSGGEKAYRYIDEKGRIYQSVSLRAPEPRQDPKFHEPLIHPQTGLPCAMPPNGFSRTPENLKEMMDNGLILFGKDETTQPRQKSFLTVDSKRQMSSLIQDAKKGKFWTDALGLSFPYCHPVSLYEEIVGAVTQDMNSITMDYFAGSGTTGHALLNLNREDQGGRKYVLVEMGLHFDTTLKPRITKVIYSSDWKNGKPASYDTGVSQCFKYIRLESYEDTLNNLEFKKTGIQGALLTVSPSLKEEYMLSYMMNLETEGSASLLNVNRFDDPWNYTMKIATGSAGETRTRPVDLVETFNYLIGLTVIRRDFLKGIEVIEGTNPEGDNVLVIWRNTKETSNEQLDEFFRKQDYNTRDTEFDLIYVNGDNNLENLKKPDETWKVRLIEEDFKRLMFEVEDV